MYRGNLYRRAPEETEKRPPEDLQRICGKNLQKKKERPLQSVPVKDLPRLPERLQFLSGEDRLKMEKDL